jgi:2'-hydroxyisoflavone reductase
MTTRRDFLRIGALTGGALSLGVTPSFALPTSSSRARRPAPKLRILFLGGTSFIGPYQVQYAIDRGHTVTLFNRGKTNPQLFPTVEKLIGDRDGDLKSLEGREWDAVVDNSASDYRAPKWVELTAGLLQKSVKQYVFTSTRSVYKSPTKIPMTVDAEVMTLQNTPLPADGKMPYGLAKAEAEKVAHKIFPGRTLVVRPSLIVGPGDLTDRFTYWPVRIERGGEILAPGDGTDPVQVIDVRDLSEWTIRLIEQGTNGTYNALGPKHRTFAELLYGILAVTTADATFTWVDTDFLTKNNVRGYREMPVWQPSKPGMGFEGFARFDISREVGLGLTFRPLAVTTRDTLDYYHAQTPERQKALVEGSPEDRKLKAGITPEREAEVLKAWHAAKGG